MRKLLAIVIVAVIVTGASALFTAAPVQARPPKNPCTSLPQVCHYKWQGGCCVADPRFDCFDLCF
jgi:hypothetical protein